MQIQRRQKGFTLVELLVVIAIIAILATVSIIGYTQFIKRANMSADQQAVTQMNTLLEGLDVTNEPDDVVDLWAYLNETGLDAEDYKPLTKDHYFFWDQSLNRILLVDKDNKVVFPEAYAEAGKSNSKEWYTLSGTIHLGDKPTIKDEEVEIASASDFIQTMADNAAGVSSMKLKGDVNMMGASHGSISMDRDFTLDGGGNTITNLVSTEYATVGTTGIFANKQYGSALFGEITSGQILIKDIVFDGLIMGSYDIGSTGILAGIIWKDATVTLQNVTFKNCTIYGQNKVGLIAGGVYGKLILEDVKVENCVVNASEGEAGMLFGMAYYKASEMPKVTADANCSITNTVVNNVEYGLHEIVDVAGAKFITKVKYADGEPKVEKKTIGGKEYTATTRCATPATIGWFKKLDNDYATVSDLYCAKPAIEVTTIAQMNANNRT
jgi:prepilin-type N-terminal cleavage/methylation domain-containing protein